MIRYGLHHHPWKAGQGRHSQRLSIILARVITPVSVPVDGSSRTVTPSLGATHVVQQFHSRSRSYSHSPADSLSLSAWSWSSCGHTHANTHSHTHGIHTQARTHHQHKKGEAQFQTRSFASNSNSNNNDSDSNSDSGSGSRKENEKEKEAEVMLELKDNGNIAILTFNRQSKANAIGKTMLGQLQDHISFLSSSPSSYSANASASASASTSTSMNNSARNSERSNNNIRCVVLTSASNRVFSAGADLKERSKMNQTQAQTFVSSLRNCMDRLSSLPMPLIASVEGAALGGGLEIALCADVIVAGSNARFGAPETGLGIIPGAGGELSLVVNEL